MKNKKHLIFIGLYTIAIIFSFAFDFQAGKNIGKNFWFFAYDMIKIFPPAFILVGLFTVWVDRKVIERYFGHASGMMGYVAGILLAFTTLYPFIVVLPLASELYKKGGKLSVVMTYLGASAICRIPMTIFEASFLGIQFTIIRYIVSLPLIVISSIIIEKVTVKTQGV